MSTDRISITGSPLLTAADIEAFAKKIDLSEEEVVSFNKLLNEIDNLFHKQVKFLETMPGGVTNKNFHAILEDGTQLAVRLGGAGTSNYIDRPGERHNASEMASIGIAPKPFYSCMENGAQITEYIDAPTMHPADFQTRDEVLIKAGEILRRIHNSGKEFASSFDPLAAIDGYLAILDQEKYEKRYEGWDRIWENLQKLKEAYKKNPPKQVPCHNDMLAENFMLEGDTMRVIDWEYSGMNDGYFDIACVCVENPLDDRCEDIFHRAYCGCEPSELEKARLLINKFLVTSHWSTWSLVQIAYGKDPEFFWEYGRVRAVQALSFLDNPNFPHYLELIAG